MVSASGGFTAQAFYRYLKEEKRLMGVRCRACGNLAVQARPMCPACHSSDMEWHQFSGKGRLSWSKKNILSKINLKHPAGCFLGG